MGGIMRSSKALLLVACGLAALVTGSSAFAQAAAPADATAATDADAFGSDDIIVQARRRDERLQDVPLAVSAVTAETLQRANITTTLDIAMVAPSVIAVPGAGGSRALPTFAIRGLSQQELTSLADSSVSVYMGDIVAARVQGLNGAVFDIGSVEVLRGPQGTLFGRNTTGGAVIIRGNKPTDKLEASAAVTLGRFDTFNVEAMVNVPMGDKASLRVAGIRLRDDGWVYDELLGRNINKTAQQAARVSLSLHPIEGLESLTVYDYFDEDDGGTPIFLAKINPTGTFNLPAARAARNYQPLETLLAQQQARGPFRVSNGVPVYIKVRTHTAANTTSFDIAEGISFKNIIGYRHVRDDIADDIDGSSNALHPQRRIDFSKQISEEAQLLGSSDKLDWITGLYYFKERGHNQGRSAVGAVDPGTIEPTEPFDFPGTAFSNTNVKARNRSYAAFAQGTYNFSGGGTGFSVTAGIRYNKDRRAVTILNATRTACRFTLDLDNNPATPETLPPLAQCRFDAHKSFSEVTYNASLEYRFDRDHLLYVAHRHGYRTGGYGARASTQAGLARTFNPETVDDVELGFKGDWHLGTGLLRTNVAAYYAKYKDIQRLLTDVTTIPNTTVTANAGGARIWGIELETLLRPIRSLEFTGNAAYTNAKYQDFRDPFSGADLSNAPFARAPRVTYTVGARYFLPVDPPQGAVSIGGSYYAISDFNSNDSFVPGFTQTEGWQLVNLDAGWSHIMGSGFDVTAFVRNLTNERYSNLLSNTNTLGYNSRTPGAPRTYGVTVRARLGG